MDLYTGTSSVSCTTGQNAWTITGTINLDGVYPGHKVFVGSRTADVPSNALRMFRIATIDRTAKTFTTTDNADQTYTTQPFFIDMDGTDPVGFATFLFTTVTNQLATMFGIGSTQFAGGGSQFSLPRDAGASAIAELAFQLRSGASTYTRSFFWRQRQVSGAEVLELIATPDGTTEISVLSVNRTTGALTISGDQSAAVTLRGDANYTILAGDRDIILNVAWTAARTFTLPANSSRALNGRIRIIDGIAAINPGTPITIVRAGSDTINGGTSITITKPRSVIEIIKTGTGQWTVDPAALGDATERALNAVLVTAADVVDTMVYDTCLDSDGGAWRHKCAHTSWYQEAASATRGARREFPLIAGLVLRGTGATAFLDIFDLTDVDGAGTPRLWMRFNGGNAHPLYAAASLTQTSVFALNGRIWVTCTSGGSALGALGVINFIADDAAIMITNTQKYFPRDIARRNTGVATSVTGGWPEGLVNRDVNHVHARVLPGAPLDQIGLPIPTVAVATAGGASVIHPWGRVYDLVYSSGGFATIGRVFLSADGKVNMHPAGTFAPAVGSVPIPYADVSTTVPPEVYNAATFPAVQSSASGIFNRGVIARPDGTLVTGNGISGVTLVAPDRGSLTLGMVSYAAINYATGWQAGDIRLAALCDTTTGNVTGTAELITNGAFTTDLSGWSDISTGTGSVAWNSSSGGRAALTGVDANNRGILNWPVTCVVGQSYLVSVSVASDSTGSINLNVGTSAGGGTTAGTAAAPGGVAMVQFVATQTTHHVSINTQPSAGTRYVDNASVKLALPDRSYKSRGLQVVGTLARAAVATGNDLAAISGFSGSNYLEQPYNPDMDFADADFVVGPIWFKRAATAALETLVMRDSATTGARFGLQIAATTSVLNFVASDGTDTVTVASSGAVDDDAWHQAAGIMRGTTMELWIDGVRVATGSAAAVDSINNASAVLRFGLDCQGSNAFGGSLALARIGATAPTPAQIARMYADEAPMFNAGARCVLGGTSNAVADLDFDEARNTLIVATADGVSEFSGLVRSGYFDTTNTALTNDNMKASASAAGYRLFAGGAQAVVQRDVTNPFDAIERYGPRLPAAWKASGRTTDATPTNLAPHVYVGERETMTFSARVNARQVGATATEYASYLVTGSAKRDAGGNVTVTNVTTTTQEVTAGMDAAAVAVTASQTIAIQVTGKAATTLVWTAEAVGPITRVSEELSYAA
ncbi:LamG domain-containing protein [Phreatobacter sp.]|uniref:LamG domain-containing protein n=1 Tax=Phreatobacter sp. TaxID=1966341 RepID=UPI003F729FD0